MSEAVARAPQMSQKSERVGPSDKATGATGATGATQQMGSQWEITRLESSVQNA